MESQEKAPACVWRRGPVGCGRCERRVGPMCWALSPLARGSLPATGGLLPSARHPHGAASGRRCPVSWGPHVPVAVPCPVTRFPHVGACGPWWSDFHAGWRGGRGHDDDRSGRRCGRWGHYDWAAGYGPGRDHDCARGRWSAGPAPMVARAVAGGGGHHGGAPQAKGEYLSPVSHSAPPFEVPTERKCRRGVRRARGGE